MILERGTGMLIAVDTFRAGSVDIIVGDIASPPVGDSAGRSPGAVLVEERPDFLGRLSCLMTAWNGCWKHRWSRSGRKVGIGRCCWVDWGTHWVAKCIDTEAVLRWRRRWQLLLLLLLLTSVVE